MRPSLLLMQLIAPPFSESERKVDNAVSEVFGNRPQMSWEAVEVVSSMMHMHYMGAAEYEFDTPRLFFWRAVESIKAGKATVSHKVFEVGTFETAYGRGVKPRQQAKAYASYPPLRPVVAYMINFSRVLSDDSIWDAISKQADPKASYKEKQYVKNAGDISRVFDPEPNRSTRNAYTGWIIYESDAIVVVDYAHFKIIADAFGLDTSSIPVPPEKPEFIDYGSFSKDKLVDTAVASKVVHNKTAAVKMTKAQLVALLGGAE